MTKMAGYARYTALLDACVLYSIAMTDALISLAVTGLFAAKWTQAIEIEWMAALARSRPELQGRLDALGDTGLGSPGGGLEAGSYRRR